MSEDTHYVEHEPLIDPETGKKYSIVQSTDRMELEGVAAGLRLDGYTVTIHADRRDDLNEFWYLMASKEE